jgi:hypothetical protein
VIVKRNIDALGLTIEAFAEHIDVAARRARDHSR